MSERIDPKVLIAAPYYWRKSYCIGKYINNIRNLSYPNFDFLLVDNSDDASHIETVAEMYGLKDWEWMRSEPIPTTRARQCLAYNNIRERFLKGGYEYLMVIETDIFPHKHIVEMLMENDKDICGAVYLLNTEFENRIPCVTLGFSKLINGKFCEAFLDFKEIDGKVKKIQGGCGLGCTLIKRKVIEEVGEFRYAQCHADTYFHRDAHRKGFETWIDTRFVVEHDPSPYPENDF